MNTHLYERVLVCYAVAFILFRIKLLNVREYCNRNRKKINKKKTDEYCTTLPPPQQVQLIKQFKATTKRSKKIIVIYLSSHSHASIIITISSNVAVGYISSQFVSELCSKFILHDFRLSI